jgi:hypothetical protein
MKSPVPEWSPSGPRRLIRMRKPIKPLYVIAAILAFVTAISGLYALREWAGQKQPSLAPVVFIVGLVGEAVIVALDQVAGRVTGEEDFGRGVRR